jgi:response regulator RpfG family c-di-GMP phosphodiesterase
MMDDKPKILYVDDESINLQLFEINFSKKYEVLTADYGIKGLEVLIDNPDIRVVVSDMKMPNMKRLLFCCKIFLITKSTFGQKMLVIPAYRFSFSF